MFFSNIVFIFTPKTLGKNEIPILTTCAYFVSNGLVKSTTTQEKPYQEACTKNTARSPILSEMQNMNGLQVDPGGPGKASEHVVPRFPRFPRYVGVYVFDIMSM